LPFAPMISMGNMAQDVVGVAAKPAAAWRMIRCRLSAVVSNVAAG
jgi:hypothetical protein